MAGFFLLEAFFASCSSIISIHKHKWSSWSIIFLEKKTDNLDKVVVVSTIMKPENEIQVCLEHTHILRKPYWIS